MLSFQCTILKEYTSVEILICRTAWRFYLSIYLLFSNSTFWILERHASIKTYATQEYMLSCVSGVKKAKDNFIFYFVAIHLMF